MFYFLLSLLSAIAPVSCLRALQGPVAAQVHKEGSQHLILHFDMNKTLIAVDKNGGKGAEELILAEIAERVTALWDPSLAHPISYSDYVHHYLLPNPKCDLAIRKQQTVLLSKVLDVLRETNHPDSLHMQDLYDRAKIVLNKQNNKQIFPSFYRLIEVLEEKNIHYTLVIRTFGKEGQEVAEELNGYFGKDFMIDTRKIREGHLEDSSLSLEQLIAKTDHHLLIEDDFQWWNNHHRNWHYGKPFPVYTNDPSTLSLFFDDNAKINPYAPETNIIFPYDVNTNELLDPALCIQKGQLIAVDMLEALFDENYYVDRVLPRT